MRKRIVLFFILIQSVVLFAQDQQLAYQYFRTGAYEKAATIFETLLINNEHNYSYLKYLIQSYQQSEQYDKATALIEKNMRTSRRNHYLQIHLGYNYQLQHQQEKADKYYRKAIASIQKKSTEGYMIARTFQDCLLLDYALEAYKKTMEKNPNANYNLQIAKIYGEKGALELMFNTYLDAIDDKNINQIKNYLGKYITKDSQESANLLFKKSVLIRAQKTPQNTWNELLSWLFIQQRDYSKALLQEKALYKRNKKTLNPILELGKIAFNARDHATATHCFTYILDNSNSQIDQLSAKLFLLQINMITAPNSESINSKFSALLDSYGNSITTLDVQMAYANYLTYVKNDPAKARAILQHALSLPLNKFQAATIKLRLADLFVFTGKYSKALIYYTQVQSKLKNHVIAQYARFKIARTSYYKGDFKWAQSQLKILKESTSQRISNDALDLNLLILDNSTQDSIPTALKIYATADLLNFQNRKEEAYTLLKQLLIDHKGHSIEDEALFKLAQIEVTRKHYEQAISYYKKLIEIDKTDILVDDAVYNIGLIYLDKLNNPTEASNYFEEIIFNYPSSIFLVEARKKYREIRGDNIQ
ncbi:MAG: tetratricopeptide repeat protein [Flavobacteriaceae bacterium]|nr:tetratricopeptide repeat protein [Flavobacteriaceae bacterium]